MQYGKQLPHGGGFEQATRELLMRSEDEKKNRQARAFRAFALAAFSCVLGLAFCLIKSPQAKSEAYLASAVQAMEEGQSEAAAIAALQSVRLNPASVEGWKILSAMLQQKGDHTAARQAMNIAYRLRHDPRGIEPVYAMPAEFRLSLLALANTGTP